MSMKVIINSTWFSSPYIVSKMLKSCVSKNSRILEELFVGSNKRVEFQQLRQQETQCHIQKQTNYLIRCRLRTMGYRGSELENIQGDPADVVTGFASVFGREAAVDMQDELLSHFLPRMKVNGH